MGAYMSEPLTDKTSEDAEDNRLAAGASSMQGWRVSQEDSHNVILDYDKDCSLFAVYDGHGGHEVAEYTAKKLPDFIKGKEAYTSGEVEKALTEAFVSFDATIIDRDVVAELKKIQGTSTANNGETGCDDDVQDPDEVDNLYMDATMPIEDVISKMGADDDSVPLKHPTVSKLGEGSSGKKPISPFLRAKKEDGPPTRRIKFNDDEDEEEKVKEGTNDDGGEEAKPNVPELKEENGCAENAVNGEAKKSETEVKQERGDDADEEKRDTLNGHSEEDKAIIPEVVKGDKNDIEAHVPTEKGTGKGKGKGKGKSNAILKKRSIEEEEKEEHISEEPPKPKNQPKKSALELYKNMLNDEEEYDDSDEDDENFETGKELEDDDDDDDDDVDGEGAGQDDESDTEDDEEQDGEGEEDEFVGGDFNEEPGNDSGCTAVVALLKDRDLFVANAGDSRCVVCRETKAIEMSFDHKPEDEPEMERIKRAGGKVTLDGRVNGGLNLSRAIGDHAYKRNKSLPLSDQMISPLPDIKKLTIDPEKDSFMVLACDGIWNSMSSQEVVDFVSKKLQSDPDKKLSSICEEMFDHCLAPNTLGDGTGCDNMTAIIVRFKKSGHPDSAAAKRPAEASPEEETPSKKPCV